jgi:hypothetical protein
MMHHDHDDDARAGAHADLRDYPHRRYRVRCYYPVTLRADWEGGRLRRLRTEPMPEGVR